MAATDLQWYSGDDVFNLATSPWERSASSPSWVTSQAMSMPR
jgi:hypothetical protein